MCTFLAKLSLYSFRVSPRGQRTIPDQMQPNVFCPYWPFPLTQIVPSECCGGRYWGGGCSLNCLLPCAEVVSITPFDLKAQILPGK